MQQILNLDKQKIEVMSNDLYDRSKIKSKTYFSPIFEN